MVVTLMQMNKAAEERYGVKLKLELTKYSGDTYAQINMQQITQHEVPAETYSVGSCITIVWRTFDKIV